MPIHRIFEYRSERDRDLLNAYRRQIAQSSGPIQLREVMYRVVNSPPVKILGLSGASYACHIKHGSRDQAEWYDTQQANLCSVRSIGAYTKLRTRPHYRQLPLSEVVQIVVEQPAPSFYMTPQSAIVIMHHIRKRRKQCNSSESRS